jgi:hypothetical protein
MQISLYLAAAFWFGLLLAAASDCLKSNSRNKAGWLLAILFVPLAGAVCYFLFADGRFVSEL